MLGKGRTIATSASARKSSYSGEEGKPSPVTESFVNAMDGKNLNIIQKIIDQNLAKVEIDAKREKLAPIIIILMKNGIIYINLINYNTCRLYICLYIYHHLQNKIHLAH